jgi:hypothetical protein
MREPIFSSLAQPILRYLDKPFAEHLRQPFHLGHGVIVNILEAAEFMCPLHLMRNAKRGREVREGWVSPVWARCGMTLPDGSGYRGWTQFSHPPRWRLTIDWNARHATVSWENFDLNLDQEIIIELNSIQALK